MYLKVTAPPTEIIDATEAANFMRAEFSADEEDLIEAFITASRQWCEEYLRRAIGVQTVDILLEAFPRTGRQAILLRPPLISVTSLKYLDGNGDEQTLVNGTDYRVSDEAEPAEIIPIGGWPDTLNSAEAVRVTCQIGYSDDGTPTGTIALPKTIRTAILMQAADLFENRESQVEKPLSANSTIERLLSMYRLEMGI